MDASKRAGPPSSKAQNIEFGARWTLTADMRAYSRDARQQLSAGGSPAICEQIRCVPLMRCAMLSLMESCALCGAAGVALTDEDVIPKWALRAFGVQGPVTIQIREERGSPDEVGRRRNLKLVLEGGLCQQCNNVRLSQLENKVKPILAPMAVECRPTTIDANSQSLLATWAVKTAFLVELALRQQHPGARPVEGYVASPPEMAWLFAKLEPPPRSLVWLGCWDCQRESPFRYGPSATRLVTADGVPVAGHFATFTLGFVAFQVFTVDFVAADEHGAGQWNLRPPQCLAQALARIWPQDDLRPRLVAWPQLAFARGDLDVLASWDDALRGGYESDDWGKRRN
jgi:hypothetical protein